MSHAERHVVSLTTDASGDAVGYTPVVTGRIQTIVYTANGSTPFDNTADFTITVESTAEAVLSASNVSAGFTKAPRQATHDVAGAASLYAAGGEPVEGHIVVARDRIKIVVAQGGDTKIGQFAVILN